PAAGLDRRNGFGRDQTRETATIDQALAIERRELEQTGERGSIHLGEWGEFEIERVDRPVGGVADLEVQVWEAGPAFTRIGEDLVAVELEIQVQFTEITVGLVAFGADRLGEGWPESGQVGVNGGHTVGVAQVNDTTETGLAGADLGRNRGTRGPDRFSFDAGGREIQTHVETRA